MTPNQKPTMQPLKQTIILIVNILLTTCALANNEIQNIAFNKIASPNVANFLEWITDRDKSNLCGGHYLERPEFSAYQNPPPILGTETTVTAKKTVLLSEYGQSELHGDVTITQPGRELVAEKVTLYRDSKTGTVTNSALFGNIHLREYGKLVIANTGNWDFSKKIITLNNAIYHTTTTSPTGIVSAWGRAKQAIRDEMNVWHLSNVSYTTCPPTTNSWELDSSRLTLNKAEGWGSSVNTVLYASNIPVFYTPYFKFPIDKRRKSGFLYPSLGYSGISGTRITTPYYFNLAPNYDFTLIPQYYSRRGVLTEGDWRYITDHSSGTFAAGYIPHDALFTTFRNQAKTNYPTPNHARSLLENSTSDRGFISIQNKNIFNQHWSSQINANYVTDDYFLRDFSSVPTIRDNDQLLNQVDVNYSGDRWRFLGRMQAFQTLHPLTESSMPQDQYMRLPQLDLNGDLPDEKHGINYQISTEFVNFDHKHDFDTGKAVTTGQRINLQPGIDYPINFASFYLDPKLQLPATYYALSPQQPLTKTNVPRVLPIFSVDSGMFFNRDINFFSNAYTQTLEPRLFYLYVPEHNQNDIPIFDTVLPAFNFEQLFRTNRFSGLDRIGDANQFAMAVTTRFLDSETAEEKLRASIGQIYQIRQHSICINNDCSSDPLATHNLSPLVGDMEYHITPYWSTKGDVSWSAKDNRFTTIHLSLGYNQNAIYLFNLGYNFVRNGDPFQGKNYDLKRFNTSVAWLFRERWHLIGNWNYNVTRSRPETYLYGIQYDNCCWAVRLIQSRTFTGLDPHLNNQFDNATYLQFLLKGLGNVGTSDAGSLLTNSIAGYHDDFATGLKFSR